MDNQLWVFLGADNQIVNIHTDEFVEVTTQSHPPDIRFFPLAQEEVECTWYVCHNCLVELRQQFGLVIEYGNFGSYGQIGKQLR
jgi:hypothetical protein